MSRASSKRVSGSSLTVSASLFWFRLSCAVSSLISSFSWTAGGASSFGGACSCAGGGSVTTFWAVLEEEQAQAKNASSKERKTTLFPCFFIFLAGILYHFEGD